MRYFHFWVHISTYICEAGKVSVERADEEQLPELAEFRSTHIHTHTHRNHSTHASGPVMWTFIMFDNQFVISLANRRSCTSLPLLPCLSHIFSFAVHAFVCKVAAFYYFPSYVCPFASLCFSYFRLPHLVFNAPSFIPNHRHYHTNKVK